VKNAVEASPAGRTVTISIRTGAGTVIDVHNYGIIPSEIRAGSSRNTDYNKENGLGLGAYSARIIVGPTEGIPLHLRPPGDAHTGEVLRDRTP
jgi:hypothetical protein